MAGNAFCFTRFLRHHFANMNNPIDQAPAGSSSNYSGGRQATGTALVRDDGTRLPDFNQANRKTLMMGGILVANGKLRQDQIDLVLNEQRVTNLRFGETAMRMRLVSHADVEEALASSAIRRRGPRPWRCPTRSTVRSTPIRRSPRHCAACAAS